MKLRVKALITGIKEEKAEAAKISAVQGRTLSRAEENFISLFVHNADMTARTGKMAYITPEHHRNIQKIIRIIGKDKLSLSAYIHNVLEQHFATYEDVIKGLYDEAWEQYGKWER